jgi:hypothetical protein
VGTSRHPGTDDCFDYAIVGARRDKFVRLERGNVAAGFYFPLFLFVAGTDAVN